MSGGDLGWLRSYPARALLSAALVMCLVLSVGFVLVTRSREADRGPLGGAQALSDEEAMNQVVATARNIIGAADLTGVNGSAVFLSCTSLHDPPYQAAVYLNFPLPETNSVRRIKEVAEAMVAAGWQQAPSMGEHFGMKLTRDGVTSTFHQNPDAPQFATMRIYGECRITSDHRNDNPAFTDITDLLG